MLRRSRKADRILQAATLLLLLSASTGCSWFKPAPPPVVLQESTTIRLEKATPAPWRGWLLSDSALAKLLEKAESCQGK